MKYWTEYYGHEKKIKGKRKKYDTNIYTLDIESTSYLILNGKQKNVTEYLKLTEKEQKECKKQGCMYIWMFGINSDVYYGRTWNELEFFLNNLEDVVPEQKFLFIHNQSFEFQFMKSVFSFSDVIARKSHKVMVSILKDYNITIKCSYYMSNCALKYLSDLYDLPVEKKVGDLDYTLIRTPITKLTDLELGYCENDILVLYYYIKYEIETYEDVKHIPNTSTGHVRRELKEKIEKDYSYKNLCRKSINVDPHVFNLLQSAFMGGYTHSSYVFTDKVLHDIDSFDECSAYPYTLVTNKFPMSIFRKCYITRREQMSKKFAYIIVVRFFDLKCKYLNHFIPGSKCYDIRGAKYDNGRIYECKECKMILTDVDFYFILDTHKGKYKIEECYFAKYDYLPLQYINFVLDKYEAKTKYKDDETKKLQYQKEKNKYNAIYGMTVTNTIRKNVEYIDESGEWKETDLTNDEIILKLNEEKKKAFLSFSWGCWCTAFGRDHLLRRVIELDDYVVYCDTDSCKLIQGYDKSVFDKYNKEVENKIENVSEILGIEKSRFMPKDIHGKEHMLGVFEYEGRYEFITQGAKKYAVTKWKKNSKIKEDDNVIQKGENESKVLEITVAGVPKTGSKCLKDLSEFKDDLVFDYEYTNKNTLFYCENQEEFDLTDYQGNTYHVTDKTACCLVPTTYVLGKALEYADLIEDESSSRAFYKE